MTYTATDRSFPATEDVMRLYEDINHAHAGGQIDEPQWEDLLASAAEAETNVEIGAVREALKEHTAK